MERDRILQWLKSTSIKSACDLDLLLFFTRHSGAVLVGDARSGDWMRFYGIPDTPDIVDRVEHLLGPGRVLRAALRVDRAVRPTQLREQEEQGDGPPEEAGS